jgi:ribosomal protein uS2
MEDLVGEAIRKNGVRLGLPKHNKYLEQYIIKRIPQKFVLFNSKAIAEKLRMAANMLSQYERSRILLIAALEDAYYSVYNFAKLFRVNVILGQYPAGSMTNFNNRNYIEPKCVFITNPSLSKNAIYDAAKIGASIIAVMNTDDRPTYVDLAIPGNNKSGRSIGTILYAIGYFLSRNNEEEKSEFDKISLADFISKELK